jgi:hypothetical protein
MSCMTLFAPRTMATTQLAQTTCRENCDFWLIDFAAERKRPLNLSWVVVTDEQGSRRLRMRWTVA